MERGKVSIIIPMYNKEKYIKETLDSAKNQSYTNLEVIIIDDKSTDQSVEIAKQFVKDDKRFRLIENEKNIGVSETRNRGMESADGEWLFFLDADDVLHRRTLEIMVECMTGNDAEIVYCDYKIFKDTFEEDSINVENLDNRLYFAPNAAKVDLRVLVSRQLICENQIKFPTGISNGEDTIFSTLICGYTEKIMDIKVPLYGWRKYVVDSLSQGEWNNPRRELPRELGMLKYIQKTLAETDNKRLKGRKIRFIRSKKNAVYGIMLNNGIDYRNNMGIQFDKAVMKKRIPLKYIIKSNLGKKQKLIEIISQFPIFNTFNVWKLIYGFKIVSH